MKIATAFSGGFGSVEFALKYENIPHEVVFACEWMPKQRESYLLNHGQPTSSFYEDIRNLDGTKYKGEIDYYHLSPPCQSYSMAGNRGGASDERGGLMFEAIKSINQVQPKMFSIENVKGLLSSNGGEDWRNIMTDLKKLNYSISWGVMNAKEQGTPQNRERVFIVGVRTDTRQMPFPAKIPLDKCLADVLEDEVDEKYYLSEKMIKSFIKKDANTAFKFNPQTRESEISPCITARYYKMAIGDPYTKELDLIQVGNIDQKGHNSIWGRVYDSNGIAATQNAKGGGMGAKTGLYQISDVFGLRTTQSCGDKHTIMRDKIRRLTPRECARVQGDFNDLFKMGGFSDTKLYEFIGNAMDISTTRNLIKAMIEFSKDLQFDPPHDSIFKRQERITKNLFEMETKC